MILICWYRHILLYFYYVASGTCCGGSELNYTGTVAKNVCSIVLEICPTPILILPDSVDNGKTDIETHLLMQLCFLNFLICRFELFRWTVVTVTRDSNWNSSPLKYVSIHEQPNKPTVSENPSIWSWICVMLAFKSISFQISQHINIVLKS